MENLKQIRKLIRYEKRTGKFFWKERGIPSFDTRYAGKEAGSIHTSGTGRKSIVVQVDGKRHYAHRLAWALVTGEWPEYEIDHKDHNTFNNKWSNLRHTTHADNTKNMPKNSRNTSGVTGVRWCPTRERWLAYITVARRSQYLGSSKIKREAAKLRRAAETMHGFHANHGR